MNDVLLAAEGYGRRVGLRMPSTEVDGVRPWLPHWWVDTDVKPQRTWKLTCACNAAYMVGELELWVAEQAVDRIFVHAGVVAIDGRAILLPGRSNCGKSTLTAALLGAGAAYGSDEFAVLSPDGRVHPYPRPLQLRNGGAGHIRSAAELGATTFSEPLSVAAVAHLRYEPGSEYRVEPIPAGVAALRLFDNTVCAKSRGAEALDAVAAATDGIRAVAGTRGEAASAVPEILALVSP